MPVRQRTRKVNLYLVVTTVFLNGEAWPILPDQKSRQYAVLTRKGYELYTWSQLQQIAEVKPTQYRTIGYAYHDNDELYLYTNDPRNEESQKRFSEFDEWVKSKDAALQDLAKPMPPEMPPAPPAPQPPPLDFKALAMFVCLSIIVAQTIQFFVLSIIGKV